MFTIGDGDWTMHHYAMQTLYLLALGGLGVMTAILARRFTVWLDRKRGVCEPTPRADEAIARARSLLVRADVDSRKLGRQIGAR